MSKGLYILLLTLVGIAALVDYQKKQIPNLMVLLLLVTGLINLILVKKGWIYALLGLFGIGALLFVVYYFSKGAIGMGDIKLLATIGLILGFWDTLLLIFIASFISGLASLMLMVLGRVNKKSKIPFAPFIFLSMLILLGDKLLQ